MQEIANSSRFNETRKARAWVFVAVLGLGALLGYVLWSGTWATGGNERSPAVNGGALTSADTRWPGAWANLLCSPDTTDRCADPDHAPRWPAELPGGLDEAARTRLAQHPWAGGGAVDGEPPMHRLVGAYRGQLARQDGLQDAGPREVALLVYASQSDNNRCHACAPWGSFFQFEREPSMPGTGALPAAAQGADQPAAAWRLVRVAVGQQPVGMWGAMAPLHVLPVSHQALGVWFVASDMAQGINSEALLAYAWVGDDWRQVLYVPTGESDGNAEDELSWQAHWRLTHDEGGARLLDMATRFSPGAHDWAKTQGHEPPQGRWRFDGQAFVRPAP